MKGQLSMAKKKEQKPATQPETKPEDEAPESKASDAQPEKKKKSAKEVTVKVGDTEFTGLCLSKRKTSSGAQVFLKIKGSVSRWFNAEDVVK